MFFDNWRVQYASCSKYNEIIEAKITAFENEYHTASLPRKDEIFRIYHDEVEEIEETKSRNQRAPVLASQGTMTTFTTVGAIFNGLWQMSVERYPELAAITDSHTQHAILACSTKAAQDQVLHQYLQRKNQNVEVPPASPAD